MKQNEAECLVKELMESELTIKAELHTYKNRANELNPDCYVKIESKGLIIKQSAMLNIIYVLKEYGYGFAIDFKYNCLVVD